MCPKGVLAAHNVVKLRGGHVLEVDELDLGCGECGIENAHKTRTRSTSVASEHHTGRVGHLNINLLHKLIVGISDALQRRIGQLCRICLPLGLYCIVSSAYTFDRFTQVNLTSSISPYQVHSCQSYPAKSWCGSQFSTHHRVNKLNSIVLRRVVTRSHHDTNPLSAELLRPQTSEQTDGENNGIEEITAGARW